MADSRYINNPIQRYLSHGRLTGIFFVLIGIVLSFFIANILVDQSDTEGLKFSLLLFVAGVTLLWFLTTEKIHWAILIMLFYIGACEGYLKLTATGATYYLVYLARNVLLFSLIVNIIIKAYNRKLDEIGLHFTWPPFSILIGFYVVWCLINIFHPEGINMMNSLAGVRPHIEFVPLYFLGFLICRKNPQYYVHILITLVIIGVLNSVAAIHQYKIGPEALPQVWGTGYEKLVLNTPEHPDRMMTVRDQISYNSRIYYDEEYNPQLRPPGLGSDHTYPAMVAQISVLSSLVLLFYYLKTKKYWILGFLILSCLVLFGGLIVSGSRSYLLLSIVGLSIGLLFYIREIFSGQKLKIIVLLIVVLTVLGGNYALRSYVSENAYDRFQNISTPAKLVNRLQEEKFINWDYTKRYLLESPLGRGLGKVGPGSAFFATSMEETDMTLGNGETEINFLLSELGVIGLSLFYIILIGTFLKSFVTMRTSAPDSYQRMASMVIFLYLLLFFLNSPWGTGAMFPQKACIWLLMGCFWALHNRSEKFFLSTKFRQW